MSYEDIRRSNQGGQAGQASRPCVMVCLSPSPSNRRVIRAAARLAGLLSGSPSAAFPSDSHDSTGTTQNTGLPSTSPGCAGAPKNAGPPGDSPVYTGAPKNAGSSSCVFVGAPIALYVGSTGCEADEDSRLRENIRYARQCGFEVHTVQGGDIPLAISEFARRTGVTDLFIGYSPQPFFFQAKRGISEKLQSYLPSVDIHIIPDQVSSSYPAAMHAMKKDGQEISWNLPDLLRVLVIMAVTTLLAGWFYQSRYSNANIITIYILAVLIASVVTSSRVYGLFAAVLYVLLFNFLFIDPRYTLLVYDSTYMMTYLVTIVAALITGTVAVRMKNVARLSAENAYQAKILLDTSNKLEMAAGNDEIVDTTCMQLVHLLNRAVLFLSPDYRPQPLHAGNDPAVSSARETASAAADAVLPSESPAGKDDSAASGGTPRFFPAGGKTIPPALPASEREQEAIRWAMVNFDKAGAFTSHFPDCRCQYLSIYSGDHLYGIVGIEMDGRPFTEFENTILLSILHESTMALENTRMEQEQKKAEIQAENERLRAGLLRSLSHDLRTPLTSIYGNASNLRSHENDLPREDRDKIYTDIMEDAGWLIAQFENILSMTKLESTRGEGGTGLTMTVENIEDVIEESLRHITEHPDHEIRFEPPEEALFAKMDSRLIMQVLINLLNNAVKYTPAGSTITVSAVSAKGYVCVEVADNGPGIPDEDKTHIFDLFYTGTKPLADSYRSLGLGLNLCAQILRAHGGDIEAADNTPSGAVFRFRLPETVVSMPEDPEVCL